MSYIRSRSSCLLVLGLGGRRVRHAPVPWSRPPPQSSQQRRTVSGVMESLGTGFNQVSQLSQDILQTIHSAGIPWYLTIPMVAVGVNLACRLPLQLYLQKLANKRAALRPLTDAWGARVFAMPSNSSTVMRIGSFLRMKEFSRQRLYKAWGVQYWKNALPIVSMAAPFVVISTALKELVGCSSWFTGAVVATTAETAAETVAATATATPQSADTAAQILAQASTVDPSLQTGGILWFSDLTVADPYTGLPIICSVLLFANIFSHMSWAQLRELFSGYREGTTQGQMIRKGIARCSLLVPLFPLFCSYLPAAVQLYWTANFAMQLFNVKLAERIFPKPYTLQWKPVRHHVAPFVIRNQSNIARLKKATSVQNKK